MTRIMDSEFTIQVSSDGEEVSVNVTYQRDFLTKGDPMDRFVFIYPDGSQTEKLIASGRVANKLTAIEDMARTIAQDLADGVDSDSNIAQ